MTFDPVLTLLVFPALALAYCSLLEYAAHRWWLHREAGGDTYAAHVTEHHVRGDMADRHTEYSWTQVAQALILPALLWLAALYFGCGDVGALWFVALVVWWKFAHGPVHRAAHGELLAARWLCPWWEWSVAHHLGHHRDTGTNYSLLFPWTDYVFGTNAKE